MLDMTVRGRIVVMPFALMIAATAIVQAKTVTLELVCNDPPELRAGTYERAIRQFEAENPGIRVNGWSIPSTPYHQDLIKGLANGLNAFWDRKKSAEAALMQVQNEVSAVMARKSRGK